MINTATILILRVSLAVARTTPTASATCTHRPPTLTPRASTSLTAPISTDVAITIISSVPITGTGNNAIIDSARTIARTTVQECMPIVVAIAIIIYLLN